MHIIVYVRLDRFYVRAFGLEGKKEPGYVVRDGVIVDSNPFAERLGIVEGMLVAEAKMLSEGKGLYPWKEDDYRQAQRDWLDVCATLTDIIEPEEFHTAYLDLSAHPNPIDLLDHLKTELESLRWKVRIGIAGTRWVAKLAAMTPSQDLAPSALLTPRRFIADYRTHYLPIERTYCDRLCFLGYQTIGEVSEIDLQILRKQFGNDAIDIQRHALGSGSTQVQAVYPPNSITENFRYDGVPETYECFEHGLKNTADRVAQKLAQDDLVGERLDLFLEHEEGQITHAGRTFSKPYHSPKSLWSNVRLLVPTAKTAQVTNLRLRAGELRKLNRIQMEFELVGIKANRQEKIATAMRQIHGVFGQDSMKLGSQMQDSRRQKVLRAWRNANGWN